MSKSLDLKLSKIQAGNYQPSDFIIADAKDGDMGVSAVLPPAWETDGQMKPMRAYREDMVRVAQSGLVDIMLMSVSSAEILADAGVFEQSKVSPAVRFNDTSDIWHPRGGIYTQSPARPFRSAVLERVKPIADLGLYAVTFYNDLERDLHTMEQYARFRGESYRRRSTPLP